MKNRLLLLITLLSTSYLSAEVKKYEPADVDSMEEGEGIHFPTRSLTSPKQIAARKARIAKERAARKKQAARSNGRSRGGYSNNKGCLLYTSPSPRDS